MQCCSKSIKKTLQGFFFIRCCLEPPWKHYIGLSAVQCCPKCIKTTLHRIFFLCNVAWSLSDNTVYGFDQCNVASRVLKQTCTGSLFMQCCLEPLRQYWIGFLPVQCCPKCIKTTLHMIFSYTKLPGASRAT